MSEYELLRSALTGAGPIADLEGRFAARIGTRFALALNSGTSALHAALLAAGVRRGDEVIVPAYTWGGSLSGVLAMGAHPVFADIDDTLTLDPEDVARKLSHRTKALILVHLFGHPGDLHRLAEICHRHGITLIEDCAQALGAIDREYTVGSVGIGCFSFSSGKTMNGGEGGMLVTNNEDIFDRALYFTQHPMRQLKDLHILADPNEFALNYRIHPLAAQHLINEWERATDRSDERRAFYERLNRAIIEAAIPGLNPVACRAHTTHAWHRFSPSVNSEVIFGERDQMHTFFADHECTIEGGYIQRPLHQRPALRHYLSSRAWSRCVRTCLPRSEEACRNRIGIRPLEDPLD